MKEKEAAGELFRQHVQAGNSAGLVQQSARDANAIEVSVSVGPSEKARFRLTYEELLERRLGKYSHVIHVNPGQLVKDFSIDVYINESLPVTSLTVPEIKTDYNAVASGKSNPLAKIDYEGEAGQRPHVSYSPSVEEQRKLGKEGIAGQFIVEYDVDRSNQAGGEFQIIDGYFVHYFAPDELETLPKYVVFVLDVSGSMTGEKLQQTKDAMVTIIDDLGENDLFTIYTFQSSFTKYSGSTEPNFPSGLFRATAEQKKKALKYVLALNAGGGTNINSAVLEGLNFSQEVRQSELLPSNTRPIMILMTDGQGSTSTEAMKANVAAINGGSNGVPIYGLAFGRGADFGLIRALALDNDGFARRIYEGSDAAIQLEDFYLQIASPKLSDVSIKYVGDAVQSGSDATQPTFFGGSEMVMVGKISQDVDQDLEIVIEGSGRDGPFVKKFLVCRHEDSTEDDDSSLIKRPLPFPPVRPLPPIIQDCIPFPLPERPAEPKSKHQNFVERLWAFKTIKELLRTEEDNERALELSLKYNFVTPLTSLVVAKPSDIDGKDAIEEAVQPKPVSSTATRGIHTAFFGPPVQAIVGGGGGGGGIQHFAAPVMASAPIFDTRTGSGSGPNRRRKRPPPPPRPTRFPATTVRPPPRTSTTTTTSSTIHEDGVIDLPCASNGTLILYDKTYLRGAQLTLSYDAADFAAPELDFDDRLTSMNVDGECCWRIYAEPNFRGTSATFGPGAKNSALDMGQLFRDASSAKKVSC